MKEENKEIELLDLKDPIKSKWRVQSFSKKKPTAICIPYIDSRDVQNRLDDVCSPENWQDDYKDVKGNVYAGIGILIKGQWIWKWDCGVETKVEKEKGEASDSFKRAAVKWGIGRGLYNKDMFYVRASDIKKDNVYPYPIDDNNKRIWDLTEYINNDLSKRPDWWQHAVEYISNGGSIEDIQKKYTLTEEMIFDLKTK